MPHWTRSGTTSQRGNVHLRNRLPFKLLQKLETNSYFLREQAVGFLNRFDPDEEWSMIRDGYTYSGFQEPVKCLLKARAPSRRVMSQVAQQIIEEA
jgi:hypothetical protein